MKTVSSGAYEKSTTPNTQALQDALLQRIRELSFPAYCQLIRLLLYRSGYSSVQIVESNPLSCTGDSNKQFFSANAPRLLNRSLLYGGLLAVSHTDLASALTLARIKQAKGVPVSRRFVDQLRGAMLRLGAEQGLLIATGTFSRCALASATQTPLPPIRLIDGKSLCAMIIERRIGVKAIVKTTTKVVIDTNPQSDTKPQGCQQAYQIDESFFQVLEKRAQFHKGIRKENQPEGNQPQGRQPESQGRTKQSGNLLSNPSKTQL